MENTEQAQVPSEAVGGQAPAAAPQPELNITDLQNIRSIIDTATRRGAFAAAEMSSVGSVFDRLNTFLNAVTPAQPQAPETPAQ